MSRLSVIAVALLAVAGCKEKSADQAAAQAPEPAPKAEPAPSEALAAPELPGGRKLLDPAAAPAVASQEQCATRGGVVTTGSLRAAAEARKVPEAKLDAVTKQLETAFVDACNEDAWPLFVLQCIGTSPPSVDSYDRCAARLPDAKRAPWDAALDAIVGKAGGETHPPPPVANPTGTTFEELCPVFVAEVARLDSCTGGNQYLPRVEAVFALARSVSIGGLVPPDAQARIKEGCDQQAQVARKEASLACTASQ